MQTDENRNSGFAHAGAVARKYADWLRRKLWALLRLIFWGTLYLVELAGTALMRGFRAVRTRTRELSEPYRLVMIAVLGAAVGITGLWITALSYPAAGLFAFYFSDARIFALNVLPPILLVLLGYFVFLRAWAAVIVSAVPTLLLAIGNYFKLRLRDEPVVFSDLTLLRTAGGIAGKYNVAPTVEMCMALALCLCLSLLAAYFVPRRAMKRQIRLLGAELCLLCVSLLLIASFSDEIYTASAAPEGFNTKLYTENYIAHGGLYPFLHSAEPIDRSAMTDAAMTPQEIYESYADADIPEEKKVQVMGIMCEAFTDFSDVPAFAENETIQSIYAPFHELQSRAISGSLLTNIFSGGTVDTEWCVLTGYSAYGAFKEDTESYVRYFADQGYDTVYQHPGHEWFYERKDVNRRLGFARSDFSENCFAERVDVDTAMFHSDDILFDHLLAQVNGRTEADAPLFSFSVTIQNHGPYNYEVTAEPDYLGAEPDWTPTTYNILSNYFYGINETIGQLVRLTDGLEESEDPVVLFVFGDHKPWLGNNKSAYLELGIDMDFSKTEGFYNTFATPYFIWANDAAKEVLGNDFVGDGGDFSPCFLLTKVFDECGWEGPGFMQFAREMRAITPVLSQRGLFMKDGAISSTLSDEDAAAFQNYLSVQYWRKGNALSVKQQASEADQENQ